MPNGSRHEFISPQQWNEPTVHVSPEVIGAMRMGEPSIVRDLAHWGREEKVMDLTTVGRVMRLRDEAKAADAAVKVLDVVDADKAVDALKEAAARLNQAVQRIVSLTSPEIPVVE